MDSRPGTGSAANGILDRPGLWASVAGALSGGPKDFALLAHSPLGWACPPSVRPSFSFASSVVLARDSHENCSRSTVSSAVLRYCLPHVWYAMCTPYAGLTGVRADRHYMVAETLQSCSLRLPTHTGDGRSGQSDYVLTGNQTDEQSSREYTFEPQCIQDASKIAMGIAANQKTGALRFLAWCLTKIFGWLFGGELYVDSKGVIALKELQKTHTIVYVPTHTSHVDYLLLSYVLFSSGLTCPHIVAGDNLNIPIIGALMRRCGAFFIRRSINSSPDSKLYKKVLSGYIETLLAHGHSIEFFIEGGRCRDGMIMKPKLGLLSYVVDAFLDANLPRHGNVAIVPVTMSYDRALEENHMIRENLGWKKEPESLWGFCKAFSRLMFQQLSPYEWSRNRWGNGGRCGRACVAFGQSINLKDFFQAHSRGRLCPIPKTSNILTEAREPIMNGDRQSMEIGRNDAHLSLLGAFPKNSTWRRSAIVTLSTAIHSQLRKCRVVSTSSMVLCGTLLQFMRTTVQEFNDSGWSSVEDISLVISWLEYTFTKHGGKCMSVKGQGDDEVGMKKISQVASMMDPLFDIRMEEPDGSQRYTNVELLRIIPSPASFVMVYSRLVQVLGVLGPRAIVSCATIAASRGSIGNLLDHNVAMSSLDVMGALRESILEYSAWIRSLLSGELDYVLGESSFRDPASFAPVLDAMVASGELQQYETQLTKQDSSHQAACSVASDGQHESIGDIVDMLIGEIVDDVGRKSSSGVSLNDAASKRLRKRSAERENRQFHVRKSIAIMEWAGRNAPESSWASLFHTQNRTSAESDSSQTPSTEPPEKVVFYGVEPQSPAELYSYLLVPLLSTYHQALLSVKEFLDVSKQEPYISVENKLVPYVHQRLYDLWESGDGISGIRIVIPALTLVTRFVESLKKSVPNSGDKAEPVPFPILVRSTSSLQGTIPRSRSSQSSLDLMSIRDSSDEMEPLGGESRNIRRSQSFDRKVNADHMCFCKELQPTAAFQEFIKRLLIFIPN